MNLILAIPLEFRLAVLFVVGTFLGSLANLGIYCLAWHPRPISPWSQAHAKAAPRHWSDRLPIVGWLGLAREAELHGRGFWIRPMLVEVLAGVGLAALYWWEIGCGGLYPDFARAAAAGQPAVLHAQFAAHVLLVWLMLVASLIDFDEKTIPDAITVPGALLGLLLAALWPRSLLPDVVPNGGFLPDHHLWLTAPNSWPAWLGGFPSGAGLAVGLGCFWAWCAALLPWAWHGRHGWRRALGLLGARLARSWGTYLVGLMAVVGSMVIAGAWWAGGRNWQGLLSALVGMAASGGMVWAVRIIGTAVLRREAMGFGDVTLMAMLGTFLGWQTCLVVFFLAPFAGLVLGLLQVIFRGGTEIPYGPFLCLAGVAVLVAWSPVWTWAQDLFALGWLVPLVILGCLALIAPLLLVVRLVKSLVR